MARLRPLNTTVSEEKSQEPNGMDSPASLTALDTNQNTGPGFQEPSQEEISMRAYQIWQEKGCPSDSALANWFEAEQQLSANAR